MSSARWCVDRETQTSLQDVVLSPVSVSRSPVDVAATPTLPPAKCSQTVDVPRSPTPCPPSPCPSPLLNRSIYSGWTAPADVQPPPLPAGDEAAVPGIECQMERQRSEPCASDPSFADSASGTEQRLTTAVRQCRQHVDDVGKEATSMERLLNELACSWPQRDRVMAAVTRLDRLRHHINATQQLLANVDTLVSRCDDGMQARRRSSTPSRTELLQRELGRLNSRLCCTVLALERATSKAICRGTQSGAVAAASSTSGGALHDPCCPGDNFTDSAVSDRRPPAAASQQAPAAGVCEQWLNTDATDLQAGAAESVSQLLQQHAESPVPDQVHPQQSAESWHGGGADARQLQDHLPPDTYVAGLPCPQFEPCPCPESPVDAPTSTPPQQQQQQQQQQDGDEMMTAAEAAAEGGREDMSLEDIHRKLGDIISDISQPPTLSGQLDEPTDSRTRRMSLAVNVSSNPSLMTDSAVASSTDLLGDTAPEKFDLPSD